MIKTYLLPLFLYVFYMVLFICLYVFPLHFYDLDHTCVIRHPLRIPFLRPLTGLCVAILLFTNGFPASLIFAIIDNLATNIFGQKKRKEKIPADLHFG